MVENLHARQGIRVHSWVGKVPRNRVWQPTLVLSLRESPGQRSLAGRSPWGRTELDMTEVTKRQHPDENSPLVLSSSSDTTTCWPSPLLGPKPSRLWRTQQASAYPVYWRRRGLSKRGRLFWNNFSQSESVFTYIALTPLSLINRKPQLHEETSCNRKHKTLKEQRYMTTKISYFPKPVFIGNSMTAYSL